MLRFLFTGIIRDRSRSLFPFITVTAGVMLTVLMYCWVNGALNGMVDSSANFSTGHVKIITNSYAEEADQAPNDLALLGIDTLISQLKNEYPNINWNPRIKFGCLVDIPDSVGETKEQGPAFGIALDILSGNNKEIERLNIKNAIVKGRMPNKNGEILISDNFAQKLNIKLNEDATLLSSTMYGSSAMGNFKIVGTIKFGMTALDRSTILADLTDIQELLDIQDGCGELLGFFENGMYDDEKAEIVKSSFQSMFNKADDEFSPTLLMLRDQDGLGDILELMKFFISVILIVFIGVMSIVLWNAGLMGNLRRYGEIGVRLAIGENKRHLFWSMIGESVLVGIIGTVVGTTLGLSIAYYLQIKGVNIEEMMKSSTILATNVIRAKVTTTSYFIGLIPGLAATFLGTAFSGIGIYRRQTSQLFKELEA